MEQLELFSYNGTAGRKSFRRLPAVFEEGNSYRHLIIYTPRYSKGGITPAEPVAKQSHFNFGDEESLMEIKDYLELIQKVLAALTNSVTTVYRAKDLYTERCIFKVLNEVYMVSINCAEE